MSAHASPLPAARRIRLRWRLPRGDLAGGWIEGDWRWIDDTPFNRANLEDLAALGNARHGHATHWVEEREE